MTRLLLSQVRGVLPVSAWQGSKKQVTNSRPLRPLGQWGGTVAWEHPCDGPGARRWLAELPANQPASVVRAVASLLFPEGERPLAAFAREGDATVVSGDATWEVGAATHGWVGGGQR